MFQCNLTAPNHTHGHPQTASFFYQHHYYSHLRRKILGIIVSLIDIIFTRSLQSSASVHSYWTNLVLVLILSFMDYCKCFIIVQFLPGPIFPLAKLIFLNTQLWWHHSPAPPHQYVSTAYQIKYNFVLLHLRPLWISEKAKDLESENIHLSFDSDDYWIPSQLTSVNPRSSFFETGKTSVCLNYVIEMVWCRNNICENALETVTTCKFKVVLLLISE